jgi:hypothetical protein
MNNINKGLYILYFGGLAFASFGILLNIVWISVPSVAVMLIASGFNPDF